MKKPILFIMKCTFLILSLSITVCLGQKPPEIPIDEKGYPLYVEEMPVVESESVMKQRATMWIKSRIGENRKIITGLNGGVPQQVFTDTLTLAGPQLLNRLRFAVGIRFYPKKYICTITAFEQGSLYSEKWNILKYPNKTYDEQMDILTHKFYVIGKLSDGEEKKTLSMEADKLVQFLADHSLFISAMDKEISYLLYSLKKTMKTGKIR